MYYNGAQKHEGFICFESTCSRADLCHPNVTMFISMHITVDDVNFSGWVVTWFLLGYTVRMFEYTVRIFRSNVGRFLYVFSSIPRKLYTIF